MENLKKDCINLARKAIENYLEGKQTVEIPKDTNKELLENKSGVFVTLEKNGQLRGCVGTFLPTQKNIATEIVYSAIAATQDPRFEPLKKDEWKDVSVIVYLLDKPEPVSKIEELDPKKYGVIVVSAENPQKIGLLLPNIEDIKTPEEQVFVAVQKAQIDPEKEGLIIYKFSAKIFKEKDEKQKDS